MFRKVLVANRGEIALRVARTCREMGIPVVAVYATADADSPVVRFADESVHIGSDAPRDSYLNIPNIIEAARMRGADAIHPGYGFLSEDPDFAEICAKEGLAFIGPAPEVMARLGNKATARALMTRAGLPLLPGTLAPVPTVDEAARHADQIGYPVIVKAVAGGGGRGMTVVRHRDDLPAAYRATRAAARGVFGDSAVYVERFLEGARHIEVQVLCDRYGAGVHLGERDCSVQRRHQKLIEETPSGRLTAQRREEIGTLAVRGALSVGYTGAGTVEFLLDPAGHVYFMEINARIQVEHPVTEMVTGIDLIRQQLLVAAGERLSFGQRDVTFRGVAIECRINAEDPARDFAPAPGVLDVFAMPGGPWIRVDTGYPEGGRVPPCYDSLLAKIIAWAPDRRQAIDRMLRALDEARISGPGIATTVDLHRRILRNPVFRADEHSIGIPGGPYPGGTARKIPGTDETTSTAPGQKYDGRRSMADLTFTQSSLMDILVEASGLPEGDRSMDPDASFGDVGLDSLAFLQLQAELSQRYGFEMPDERAECTFGEIVTVVAEFLGAQLPAAGHGALVTEGAGA